MKECMTKKHLRIPRCGNVSQKTSGVSNSLNNTAVYTL